MLSALHLTADFTASQWGVWLTKPLLMTTLAAWFFFQADHARSIFHRWMLAGMLFSIGGDTLLMFVTPLAQHFFLLGLGSFLLTHLCYITAFLKYPKPGEGRVARQPLAAAPLLIFLLAMLAFLWNDLPGAFKIPVAIYSLVLTGMAAACLNMKGRVNAAIFPMLFAGALLFVLSDSVLAVNKFKPEGLPLPFPHFWIMITYITGQFLIAKNAASA